MAKSTIRTAILAAALAFAAAPAFADDLPADAFTDASTDGTWTSDDVATTYTDGTNTEETGAEGSCYGDTDVTRC